MSTYAERKAAWEAHNLHRVQASIWAAERARVFREQEIERLAQEQMEEDRIRAEERLGNPAQRDYLKERARKMYRQGYTMKQIAEKLSVSYQRARSWVVDLSRGNRGRAYLSPEVIEGTRARGVAEIVDVIEPLHTGLNYPRGRCRASRTYRVLELAAAALNSATR